MGLVAGLIAVGALVACPSDDNGDDAPPGLPSNVRIERGNELLVVIWDAVTATPAVTAYEVKYGTAGDSIDQTLAPNPTATSATISGLTNGTPYLVTVAAINAEGTGPSSTPISGTPRAGATGDAPTVAFANTTTMVAEDADTTARTRVADIAVTNDAAGGETLSLGGADMGSFQIDSDELYLNAGIALDFETKTTYSVTVTAADSDGNSSATFTLMVGNVDDEPPTVSLDHPDDADTTPITGSTVNEGVSVRTKLADIVVTDADGAAFALSLALDDTTNFELGDGDTSLYLRAGETLAGGTLPVTVTATDTGGRTDSGATATFTLTVNSGVTTARLVTGPITNLMSNGGNSGAFTVQIRNYTVPTNAGFFTVTLSLDSPRMLTPGVSDVEILGQVTLETTDFTLEINQTDIPTSSKIFFVPPDLTTEQIRVAIPATLLQEDTTDTNGDSTSLGNQHGIGNEDVVITIRAKATVPAERHGATEFAFVSNISATAVGSFPIADSSISDTDGVAVFTIVP